jgi:hypothetical protein
MPEVPLKDFFKDFGEMESSFHQPIGEYVFTFGRVEFWVDQAVSKLMNVEYFDVGRYPLSELDFLSRVKLLRVFCRGCGDQIEGAMKAATIEMEEENTFRNNLVHGPWTAFFRGGAMEDTWQKPGMSRQFRTTFWNVTKIDIKTKTARIQTLMTEIDKIVEQARQYRADKKAAAEKAK